MGATLKLWGGVSDSGCCSVADVDDARRVAQMLGIDHHVFNYTDEFERHVVAPFVEGYARGLSPNPCIECNRHIKFDLLFERARRLGFEMVATGHHAQVVERDGEHFLVRGADDQKDQSYVLGYLGEAQLASLLLPIGAMNKSEVRQHAERLGLRTWDKPDSQDVCFIEASKGREVFLRQRLTLTPAVIVDRTSGEELGRTEGAELMTVGQRRGVLPERDGDSSLRLTRRPREAPRRSRTTRGHPRSRRSPSTRRRSPSRTRDLVDGTEVLAQWSAHGSPQRATLRHHERVVAGAARRRLGRWRPVSASSSIASTTPRSSKVPRSSLAS